MMLVIPIIELFLLAYSAVFTIEHIPMAIFDQSQDQGSRELINAYTNSQFFDVAMTVSGNKEVVAAIDEGKVKAGLIIPSKLSEKIARGEGSVSFMLDGSDLFTLQSSFAAANVIAQQYSLQLLVKDIQNNEMVLPADPTEMSITTSVQTLYNPNREDLKFIIPGVVAIILQMFAIIGVATTIVRERELGGAEQLLATPIRPLENILGKIVPYIVLCLFELLLVHFFGHFWFGVEFKGSFWLYLLLSFIFIFSSLGIGMLISTLASNQNQIQQIAALILLFSFLLSGLVFSRMPMPEWAKFIGGLLPMTYFLPIVRGIMIKGVGISNIALWKNVGVLFGFCAILLCTLPLLSRKRLD